VLLLTLLAVAPTDAVLFVVHCVCELLSDRGELFYVDAEGERTKHSSHLGLNPRSHHVTSRPLWRSSASYL